MREFRRNWRIPNHKELWFRAEDERHFKTRLQPSLYRPNAAGKRKRIKKLLLLENDLYEDFTRVCGTQLGEIKLDDEWDPYFLMQHHGVPTRLLDWSDGALIALHFAVRNKSEPFKTGSIIYVLDPWWLLRVLDKHPDRKEAVKRWDKYNKAHPHDSLEDDWDRLYLPIEEEELKDPLLATPEIPLLWDSPHVSRRVAAQRSRFMIFGTDPEWLSKLASNGSSRIVSLYVVVPWLRGNGEWRNENGSEPDVWEVIEDVKTFAKIDPDRRYISGHSWGGDDVWAIVLRTPDLWAAAGIMAGSAAGIPAQLNLVANAQHVPFFLWKGAQDPIPNRQANLEYFRDSLAQVGDSPKVVIAEGVGHNPRPEEGGGTEGAGA